MFAYFWDMTLGVVRFLAFLLVFLHHNLPNSRIPSNESILAGFISQSGYQILNAIASGCGMGLCLFFCLSAYLITELLLKERANTTTVSIRKFYIRRVLRIWPLYFFGIGIGIAWALAIHQRQQVAAFGWFLLFAGNLYCAATVG
jgi:peptidoglycan/LPS O-acetylase OafA/YrhL